MSASEDKFEEEKFMKILVNLKDTQESIQGFSGWCIKNRRSAYKMARCWIKVIKKVRIEQKLVLFYLVNDIVQHAAKRSYSELLDKFRSGIKEAMPHLKEEKIGPKVQRCLDIWEEREVFDTEYIQELTGLIDLTPVKEDEEIVENFQPPQLCTQIKIMKALEDDADYKLKTLKENDLDNKDIEEMKLKLKDKHCGDEFVHEFEDGTKRMEQYIKAMEREITKRRQVIEMLGQGKKYYDSLYGEAEIVATAYSNFGQRVKKVNVKLAERQAELGAAESPVPSPDFDAPSPAGSGDEMQIRLPDEGTPGTPPRATPDLASRLSSLTGGEILSPRPPAPAPKKDRYSISEFLTKMAQGEQVDVNSFIGGEPKRRRVSPPQEPSRPVPDWLASTAGEEVQNLALSRLRQAAQKNKADGEKGNGVASNLIPLTGSPGPRARVQSGGTRRSCDMELSEGEEGEAWEGGGPGYSPGPGPGYPAAWPEERTVRQLSSPPSAPPDNGHFPPHRAPPPPAFRPGGAGPPPGFPPAPPERQGEPFPRGEFPAGPPPDHSGPPPPFEQDAPPPFLGGRDGPPPPFQSPGARPPRLQGPPRGLDRATSFGGFESRGGGGHRGFESAGPRFSGPPPFRGRGRGGGFPSDNGGSDNGDRYDVDGGGFEGHREGFEGRGGFRGRGGGFRGGFEGGGEGEGRGGWEPRRPWGGPRGRGQW